MNDYQEGVIEEIIHYFKDPIYPYALMIDGSWGIGKSFFVRKKLIPRLEEKSEDLGVSKVKFISLYGCNDPTTLKDKIYSKIIDDEVNNIIDMVQKGKVFDGKNDRNKGVIKFILPRIKNLALKEIEKLGIDLNALEMKPIDFIEFLTPLSEYLIIFDDIERCKCQIDELFGTLNELVEHEGAKLILVANESEIMQNESNSNRALEIIAASNDKLYFPDPDMEEDITASPSDHFSLEEVNDRVNKLFKGSDSALYYKRVKEKIIGHTIAYKPDVTSTMHLIAAGLSNKALADIVDSQVGRYSEYMSFYKHCNFRTFQFFLSKASFLYSHCSRMQFDEDVKASLMREIVWECFQACLVFKAGMNYEVFETRNVVDGCPIRLDIPFIMKYVEIGEYSAQVAKKQLLDYSTTYLINDDDGEDPLNLLREQRLIHDDKWILEQYSKLNKNLKKGKYSSAYYGNILNDINQLTEMGFDNKMLDDTIAVMENNIRSSTEPLPDIIQVRRMSEKEAEEAGSGFFIKDLDRLNDLIKDTGNQNRYNNLKKALASKNWVRDLEKFITKEKKYRKYLPLLSQLTKDEWLDKLFSATPEEIDKFRSLIDKYYTVVSGYNARKQDRQIMSELSQAIPDRLANGNDEIDKVLKYDLKLLGLDMLKFSTDEIPDEFF